MNMAANKFKKVYSVRCFDAKEAKKARETGANVLCLGGNSTFEDTVTLVDTFLETEPSGEERHERRLRKMDELASE